MDNHDYCVYILPNKTHTVLYTGVTNNLYRRIAEHKSGKGGIFTSKLIFYGCGKDVNAAIEREKQIKGGSRQKKINLIEEMNPE